MARVKPYNQNKKGSAIYQHKKKTLIADYLSLENHI